MSYALITGACCGIGKALAIECARRNINVLLVSHQENNLSRLAASLSETFGISAFYFSIDLTDPDAPRKVYDWAASTGASINILLNNVGIGKGGSFWHTSLSDYQYMITLNNRVLIEMTYHFVDQLKKNAPAYIMNTSSIEATLPLPYKTTYTATKNFIYAFSLALRQELKFFNVSVSVLCPGPVLTNADGLSRMNAHGARSKLLMMQPDAVARIALRKMFKRKQVIVPGFVSNSLFALAYFVPLRLKMNILERLFRVYKTDG